MSRYPTCTTVAAIADVLAGKYAAGNELCISSVVKSVSTGYDGMTELRINESPTRYVDVEKMYQNAGVVVPMLGQTVTLRGTVRWDASHAWIASYCQSFGSVRSYVRAVAATVWV